MSKLSKLRGGAASPTALFTNNNDTSVQSVFDRMLSNKPKQTSNFPPKKVFVPSRFRVAKGDTKTLVILDEKFSFGMSEHSLQGPDGKWTTERCLSAWDSCPLCLKENVNTYDVVLLTVLDLSPWTKTNADGTKTEYPYTKRVIAVKKGDLAAFSGLLSVHGDFRGLVLNMTRGTGDKESANGKPTFVAKLTEDELVEEFGSAEVLSENGKVIRPANDATFPFGYERHFPVPSRMELQRKYGLGPRPGAEDEDAGPPFDIDGDGVVTLDLNELVDDEPPLNFADDLPEVV